MTGPVFKLRLGTKDIREDEGEYVTSYGGVSGLIAPNHVKAM